MGLQLELIPKSVRIGLLMAVIAGAMVTSWTARGIIAERDIAKIEADLAKQREKAVTNARAQERAAQEIVNAALKQQNQTLAGIAGRLDAQLGELRKRPDRPAGAGENPQPACAGATGADLSGPDAGFLAREAARADAIRAGLIACYQVIDGLQR